MGKIKGSSFNKHVDETIKKYMGEWGHLSNCYVKISREKIPQYTAGQIRQRWLNNINPNLCGKPLDETEKEFIVQWVKTHQTSTDKIHWKGLIHVMKDRFGELHSENKIKNFFFSRKRRMEAGLSMDASNSAISTVANFTATDLIQPPITIQPRPNPPKFNDPEKMNPIF